MINLYYDINRSADQWKRHAPQGKKAKSHRSKVTISIQPGEELKRFISPLLTFRTIKITKGDETI